MPVIIENVEPRHGRPGQPGEYRVSRNHGSNIYVYAKDEVDAFTKALSIIEKEKKEMRTITVCTTIGFLVLLSAMIHGCESRQASYASNMKQCLAAGKNYVSEAEGYSCRDAAAVPKPKGSE